MSLDKILKSVASGPVHPLYLVSGDLALAEPQAEKIAEALAAKAGCQVQRYRRPALAPLLADLRTYSLFSTGKVVLATDTAVLADRNAAADLVDQAAEVLPVDADAELGGERREAASRLLQAFRVFGVDPAAGAPEQALASLPDWAFQGGVAYRKSRQGKARTKKDARAIRDGLASLLAAALHAELTGFAQGDLAELEEIVRKGLPSGHALVLAETSVASGHPLIQTLEELGASLALGRVSAGWKGAWQGLEPLLAELARETGVAIAHDAQAELARRTLRQSGDWAQRGVEGDSMSRFAGEYRKLASMAGGGRITRKMVVEAVEDRGEENVWEILDALGGGRGDEALGRLRRYLAAADDVTGARLSFFGLLSTFCRHMVAVRGIAQLVGVPLGEPNYKRFEQRMAPALQAQLPDGGKNPLAGLKPFRLYKAYSAASKIPAGELRLLPWRVLETELRIKGDSTEADVALSDLAARLVVASRG